MSDYGYRGLWSAAKVFPLLANSQRWEIIEREQALMHSYELDGRGRVTIVLAAGSVLLVWLLDVALGAVDFEPQWWLSLPSFGGFYGILYQSFDHYLWKWAVLRKLRLVNVPDLHGSWTGEVRSSYVSDVPSLPVSVLVQQRWSKLVIRLEAAHSRSHSVAAMLRTRDLPYPTLDYMYRNEPRTDAPETMHTHRGTAMLELKEGSVLEGDYYTGRDRREIGTMELRRE